LRFGFVFSFGADGFCATDGRQKHDKADPENTIRSERREGKV
jgi:hypothetical protein